MAAVATNLRVVNRPKKPLIVSRDQLRSLNVRKHPKSPTSDINNIEINDCIFVAKTNKKEHLKIDNTSKRKQTLKHEAKSDIRGTNRNTGTKIAAKSGTVSEDEKKLASSGFKKVGNKIMISKTEDKGQNTGKGIPRENRQRLSLPDSRQSMRNSASKERRVLSDTKVLSETKVFSTNPRQSRRVRDGRRTGAKPAFSVTIQDTKSMISAGIRTRSSSMSIDQRSNDVTFKRERVRFTSTSTILNVNDITSNRKRSKSTSVTSGQTRGTRVNSSGTLQNKNNISEGRLSRKEQNNQPEETTDRIITVDSGQGTEDVTTKGTQDLIATSADEVNERLLERSINRLSTTGTKLNIQEILSKYSALRETPSKQHDSASKREKVCVICYIWRESLKDEER